MFAFNEDYLENEKRPTLSLSFKDPFGALITKFRPYNMVVPPFFSNLLPEGPPRKYLAECAGVTDAGILPPLDARWLSARCSDGPSHRG
ncbi:HipA N-terminal domain-containing protein [Rhizobium leguminosarum]